MEKDILKTLIYSDIFDYPLNVYEIHKWLLRRKVLLRQVEKALEKLRVKGKVKRVKNYYLLQKRKGLVEKRRRREEQSAKYFKKVKLLISILKVIPWIKLVGISGGLAMENASKSDDIDLFVITSKKRLWLSRLSILGVLTITGQRRKVSQTQRETAGKICCNILVDEDNLEQNRKDLYTAHEVLQMKVLWERDNIYSKYLSINGWVFRYFPNWVGSLGVLPPQHPVVRPRLASLAAVMRRDPSSASPLANILELFAKKLQMKIMKKPKGMERIEEGALYFHPNDIRNQILKEYKQKVKTLIIP